MGRVVLDTSVAIAILDARDAHHGSAVAILHEHRADERLVPLIVLGELLVGAHRRSADHVATIEAFVAEAGRLVDLSPSVMRAAARLRASDRALSLPDAIVVATGDEHDATVLTADRRWGSLGRRVRVLERAVGQ